ncbi:transcriptional regulator GutM [Terrilactibacillus laevilacticus]|uniref:Transcriptional regulator GutM n=1 Tax=Terrilactibacillus laevilacticus TaxID=1380157 RepID=A0ABW5PRU8_9BACI|nr:transcriptional regulator GutM [Terrilactibacillus laevilacticus]
MFFITLMIFIGGAFIVQMALGYLQMRHFSHVFTRLRRKGKVAIGRKKGRLRSGTIVFIRINEQGDIFEVQKMQGVTVLARFKALKGLTGKNIKTLGEQDLKAYNNLLRAAIEDAVNNYKIISSGGTIPTKSISPLQQMVSYGKSRILGK